MKRGIIARFYLVALLMSFTCAVFAQAGADSSRITYLKTITQRAGKIAAALELKEQAKLERVTVIIRDQYDFLNDIYILRDATVKGLKEKYAADKTELEAVLKKETANTDQKLAMLQKQYIAKLGKELSQEQVEQVKNGMTYNVLPNTYKAYQEMILTLSDAQKQQILVWLTEARDRAMDAESSDKKHAWFGKYKGRINNYLSAAGYDLKKEGEDWQKRIKAGQKTK